jgi:hypothetical protein
MHQIFQLRPQSLFYNMRYYNPSEDRFRETLSKRLTSVQNIFGHIPDSLEDICITAALWDE